MSLVEANGIGVISGKINMPLVGVWSADLVIDQPDGTGFDAGTSVSIVCDGGFTLTGTVAKDRTGDYLDSVHVRVLGGAGGMATVATPKSFATPGARVTDVLSTLTSDAGETVSSTADQALLATDLHAWTVTQMPCSRALGALLDLVAPLASWRILADGTLWVGTETWPSASPQFDIISNDPSEQSFFLGVDVPAIIPGTVLDEVGQVNRVEHEVSAKGIRSHVWVTINGEDRGIKESIAALVAQSLPLVDFHALYECKLVSQPSDTTVDLQPNDTRLPGMGRVPLRHGMPGAVVRVSQGAKILLGWANGDPRYPFAEAWAGGESVQSIQLAGNTPVARKNDHGDVGHLTLTVGGTATLAWTYVDPDGTTTTGASGAPIALKNKNTEGSAIVGIG